MRQYIKAPTAEVMESINSLISAVDAHIATDYALAASLFDKANCPITWKWLNDAWANSRRNIINSSSAYEGKVIPKTERDKPPSASIKKEVLARDGYRCRYCGLPVVLADIRKIAHQLYPAQVPWGRKNTEQHSGFQVTWLQFEHVIPRSQGGHSSLDNLVVSCALCNFAKGQYLLEQLDLEHPLLREPVNTQFDGLERLRPFSPKFSPKKVEVTSKKGLHSNIATGGIKHKSTTIHSKPEVFFFAGAHISSGYVNVPPIAGKSRWFKIGPLITAEMAERHGIQGCLVYCPREMVARRGLDVEKFLDVLRT